MFETTMAIFKNTMVFEASQPSVESRALAWSSGALFFREKKTKGVERRKTYGEHR